MSRQTVTLAATLVLALAGMMVAIAVRGRVAPRPAATTARPAPAPSRPLAPLRALPAVARPRSFELVRPAAAVVLRRRPGGPILARVGAKTEFGSPTTFAVAAQRTGWLGVTTSAAPNGQLAWLRAPRRPAALRTTHVWLRVSLSRRRLELLDGRRVVRRVRVGIGRPDAPTPVGRFAITDKLDGAAFGPYYGCCVLALSGHQGHIPAGWQGGSRLAIHGTDDPSSIGVPSSAGCLHAEAADLRVLMRKVPLGAPVFIRG